MLRESTFAPPVVRRERVGIIGGGQLAQMMIQAAIPLGIDVRVLAGSSGEAAALAASDVVVGSWQDRASLLDLADGCDVVTFDHELVADDLLASLEDAGVALRPSAAAMATGSNKVAQRHLAASVGITTTTVAVATTLAALGAALEEVGLPAVVKAVRGGYDGRGVRWVTGPGDVRGAIEELRPSAHEPVTVEPALSIDAELAVVVARGADGTTATYPVVQTEQVDGICVTVTAPAAIPVELADRARAGAEALAAALEYIGVLAVEFFVVDGQLLLNELAPRPHNSGHYTIDACVTSQFENHLRAVLGWPLGDPSMKTPAAVMANVIAADHEAMPIAQVVVPAGARVHLYGKAGRSGRKIGHVTATGSDLIELGAAARSVASQLAGTSRSSQARSGSVGTP